MDCYEEGDIERVRHVVFDVSTLKVIKGLEIPEKTVSYWY